MVLSSIPPYLDPSNWQQQPPPSNHHHNHPGGSNHPQPPPPPPPPLPLPHGGGSIRPGSMADRARLANIPMPEGPLKCPRCESTNTKFCYFNNYNLSQPRHFCKACRRYWTRGGALRNVPVGGGCRKNKRSKGSSSKSSTPATTTSGVSSGVVSSGGLDILGFGGSQVPNLRAMVPPPPLHCMTDFGSGGLNYGVMIDHDPQLVAGAADLNFPAASGVGGMERLRFAQMTSQFPFMGGSDPYQFEGTLDPPGFMASLNARPKAPTSAAPVKMEDGNNNNSNNNNNQELNLSSQFLGMMNPPDNDHQVPWNGSNPWKMDLSSFSSSTSNNPP